MMVHPVEVSGKKSRQRINRIAVGISVVVALLLRLDGVDSFLALKSSRTSFNTALVMPRLASPVKTPSQLAATAKSHPVERTDEEWQELLTPDQYYVLRKEGTETPGASELNFVKEPGTFVCAGCGSPLFVTDAKYDSGTGWPSFFAPITSSAIDLDTDFKLLFPRTECSCSQCGGHLGHVFEGEAERFGAPLERLSTSRDI
jgi:peptide-methionine (R)-S-oxide reductase